LPALPFGVSRKNLSEWASDTVFAANLLQLRDLSSS
jgi:hypothetical protein